MVPLSVVVCLSLLALAGATNVRQCKGRSFSNLKENVQLSPCQKPPCLLKKGSTQEISVQFVPEADVDDITNSVTAEVLGLEVPFIGVDGKSICNNIYSEDGEKVSCPLKAGTKYVYKGSFPVLPEYPSLNTLVKWILKYTTAGESKEATCFMVPVSIVT